MAFGKMLSAIGVASALALTTVGTVGSAAFAADTAAQPAVKPAVQPAAQANPMTPALPVISAANNAAAANEVQTPSVTLAQPSNLPSVHSDGTAQGIAPLDLVCGNFSFNGPSFTETCNGSLWQPFVDCSDGNRYVSTVDFSGLFRVRLTCPAGVAVAGGAFDLS
ncbi:hypothetical protein [Kitasatospora sp. CB01950]|uniref:hypothetical protein n=1 Tax=Kitasatospora sp. CB01950 TaxID=1703930 RepID=UPI00093EE8E3|nr:hypothetical protein [Kitasatospora sp. CB01950]OKJ02908.1 hypothetical protein AMK19_27625 [Kitasatospora sp. CB01950]